MRSRILVTAALAVGLAACGSPDTTEETTAADATTPSEPATDTASEAVAELQTAEGAAAGTATATVGPAGIMIALNVMGLPPGEHGVHVHTTGSCEAPTFESAGGHWNPENQTHGLEGAAGQHAGDMPNLTVAEDGTGTLEYQLMGGTFEGLLDADGSAFVVHADPDDQMTDPSGNSGARIACGVFSAS